MKANIEYKLDGSFKVDSFDRNGKLLDTTDYFSNFITYSGLMYPLTFPFAECFKFLTLGSSNAVNTTQTTGIASLEPISFKVENVNNPSINGTQIMSYLGPKNYSSGNCGTTVPKTGPSLYRAWQIPTGLGDLVCAEDINIGEFMVSPGSGSDPSGRIAFSRVPREVTIKSGTSAIVSYRLKLNIDTGINLLTGFDLSQADKSEGELVTGWSGVTGFYRQVYHGLSLIDKNGNSFIPKFGDVMEPSSKNINKFFAYFSADNSQFDCSTSGGKASSFNASYQANGLAPIAFNHDYSETEADAEFKPKTYSVSPLPPISYISDIRLKSTGASYYNFTGSKGDGNGIFHDFTLIGPIVDTPATAISVATPGHIGFKKDVLDFRNKSSVAAGIFPIKFNPTGLLQQNRKKTIVTKAVFTPVRNYGHNTRYGSFVYGFNNNNYWPIIDCLFSNSSGQLLMDHWRKITGIHIADSGSGVAGGSSTILSLSPVSYGKFNYFPLVNQEGQVTGWQSPEVFLNLQNSGISANYSGTCSGDFPITSAYGNYIFTPLIGNTGTPATDNVCANEAGDHVTGSSGTFQYDKALAAHSFYNLTFPTTTGDIYAETSASSKNKITIDQKNLIYYREGFGYISKNAYPFSQTKQLFAGVKFHGIYSHAQTGILPPIYADHSECPVDYAASIGSGYSINQVLTLSGGTYITPASFKVSQTGLLGSVTQFELFDAGAYIFNPNNPVAMTGVGGTGAAIHVKWLNDTNFLGSTGQNKALILGRSTVRNGFYITSKEYTDKARELDLYTGISGTQSGLANSLTGFVLSGFSGYIYSGSTFFTGVKVVTEVEPSVSDYTFLIKLIDNEENKTKDYRIPAIRVIRLFDSGDYLCSMSQRGSGLTLPDNKFTIKFSGKDTSNNDLYLTYLNNPNNVLWSGTSQMTGLIEYTNFSPPILFPMHEEMGSLKPNNYSIGYTGNTISMENHGGVYPGLSDLNTLTIDINTFWSAPCGGVAGCTDPV